MSVVQINGVLKARKHERITALSAAAGLTSTNYLIDGPLGGDGKARKQLQAEEAIITVETQSIRWRIDSGTPTSTSGHTATAGSSITLTGAENIAAFKAIELAASAAISVTYFFRQ